MPTYRTSERSERHDELAKIELRRSVTRRFISELDACASSTPSEGTHALLGAAQILGGLCVISGGFFLGGATLVGGISALMALFVHPPALAVIAVLVASFWLASTVWVRGCDWIARKSEARIRDLALSSRERARAEARTRTHAWLETTGTQLSSQQQSELSYWLDRLEQRPNPAREHDQLRERRDELLSVLDP